MLQSGVAKDINVLKKYKEEPPSLYHSRISTQPYKSRPAKLNLHSLY